MFSGINRLHGMSHIYYLNQRQFEFKDKCAQGCPLAINECTRHISLTHIWQWAWHLFAFVAFCFCLWTRDAGAAIKTQIHAMWEPLTEPTLPKTPSRTESQELMNRVNYLSSQLAHRC